MLSIYSSQRNKTVPVSFGLTFIKPYLPFLVAFMVVLTLTTIFSLSLVSGYHTYVLMNSFMGFFYIVFAIPKLFDTQGFSVNFSKYDVVAKKFPNYAKIYPFIELTLGSALLLNTSESSHLITYVTLGSIIIVSGVSLLGIGRALKHNMNLDCACLGSKFSFPLSFVAVLENSSMLCMAILMLVLPSMSAMPM
jgi:hypothetical protein